MVSAITACPPTIVTPRPSPYDGRRTLGHPALNGRRGRERPGPVGGVLQRFTACQPPPAPGSTDVPTLVDRVEDAVRLVAERHVALVEAAVCRLGVRPE